METVVFGKRAVEHIGTGDRGSAPPSDDVAAVTGPGTAAPDRATLQRLAWERAGLARSGESLQSALDQIRTWPAPSAELTRDAFEQRQMTVLLSLMLQAALTRTESRGAHFRTDFPQRDDARWRKHQVMRRAG